MAGPSEPESEFKQGMADSPEGHPLVVFLINAVLSTGFATTVIYLAALVGVIEFTLQAVGLLTLVTMAATYLFVQV